MTSDDVLILKKEIELCEKTLKDLVKKWGDDGLLKQIAKTDQPKVWKTVETAKRLASALIPNITFKLDLLLRSPNDRRLFGITVDEWSAIKPKVETIQRELETLGTGVREEYPSKQQIERDLVLGKKIEESLRMRKSQSAARETSKFHNGGRGDMGGHVSEAEVGKARDLGIGDARTTTSQLLYDADYDKELLENVKTLKKQLSRKQESSGTLSAIVDDVCPDAAESVKQYIRSLASSTATAEDDVLTQEMVDEIRGLNADEVDRRRAERSERLAKSNEIREMRIQTLEKLSEVDNLPTRPPLPSPLPIDGFLEMVETLPGEIQKLVSKESKELADYYKNQVFMKKQPISCRRGKLTSLGRLKPEYQDERFDASDFHMRVPESVVAETREMLKKHEVDNAVGRYFGTFSSPSDYSGVSQGMEDPQNCDDDDGVNHSLGTE